MIEIYDLCRHCGAAIKGWMGFCPQVRVSERYAGMINCKDCKHWDAETEYPRIMARLTATY